MRDSAARSSKKCFQRRSQELCLSHAPLQKILKKDLQLYSYRIQIKHKLTPGDKEFLFSVINHYHINGLYLFWDIQYINCTQVALPNNMLKGTTCFKKLYQRWQSWLQNGLKSTFWRLNFLLGTGLGWYRLLRYSWESKKPIWSEYKYLKKCSTFVSPVAGDVEFNDCISAVV